MDDEKPQLLLDQLHQIDIPHLYSDHLDAKSRKDEIKLATQKVKAIKKSLKQEIDLVKRSWDGRNTSEAMQERLHLAPYMPLDNLISQIEIALTELDIKGLQAKPLSFGAQMVGDFDTGEWHIYTMREGLIWFAKQNREQIATVEQMIVRTENLLRSYSGLIFVLFALLIGIGCFILLFISKNPRDIAIVLAIAGGLFIIIAVWALINWRNKRVKAREKLSELHALVWGLKQHRLELKRAYQEITSEGGSEGRAGDD